MAGDKFSDSRAALGIAQRPGICKLRHVRTQPLWVQEVRSEGRLGYKKVLGSRNPSDALTKFMPGPLLDEHMATVGLDVRGGRADTAPTLDVIEAYTGLVEQTLAIPRQHYDSDYTSGGSEQASYPEDEGYQVAGDGRRLRRGDAEQRDGEAQGESEPGRMK